MKKSIVIVIFGICAVLFVFLLNRNQAEPVPKETTPTETMAAEIPVVTLTEKNSETQTVTASDVQTVETFDSLFTALFQLGESNDDVYLLKYGFENIDDGQLVMDDCFISYMYGDFTKEIGPAFAQAVYVTLGVKKGDSYTYKYMAVREESEYGQTLAALIAGMKQAESNTTDEVNIVTAGELAQGEYTLAAKAGNLAITVKEEEGKLVIEIKDSTNTVEILPYDQNALNKGECTFAAEVKNTSETAEAVLADGSYMIEIKEDGLRLVLLDGKGTEVKGGAVLLVKQEH